MSDIEDDYSVSSGSEGANENNYKKSNFVKNRKINTKPTISDYDEEDDNNEDVENEIDEDDVDGDDDDDDEDEDDKNYEIHDADINEIENDDIDESDNETDEELYDEDDVNEDENNSTVNLKTGGAKINKKGNQEKKQNTIQLDVENDDDDDDYQDENYLQKFDKEITKDYIMNFHPECLNHNYDEIKSLSKVTRDEFNIIIDPLHKTVPFLTKYEKARILGQRSKQIECGSKPFVKVPENIIDSYVIAELELEQKAIPFIIRRPIPSGGSEYWNLKDLEFISF
jgi:DNA-directed RNA polymerase subunit K/omega